MYTPVLKNRTIEMSVIKELIRIGISAQTIPTIEIIQEKTRSNSSKTFVDDLRDIFVQANHDFFLDIPKLNVTTSTAKSIQEFMTPVNRVRGFAYGQILQCKDIPGIIPVASFNQKEQIETWEVSTEVKQLRSEFSRIALRLSPNQYSKIGGLKSIPLQSQDFFMLDIGDKGHTNPIFKKIYREINEMKKQCECTTFIINANRPASLLNKNIVNGEPIEEIDNSLMETYNAKSYKFDGFGDYACINNALPTSGGAISPAGIYYSLEGNFFVGYKGRTPSLSEFDSYIAPSIISSVFWAEFDEKHHEKCPGCKKIWDIAHGTTGKNQGMWKGITMGHYIYTIDEDQSKQLF